MVGAGRVPVRDGEEGGGGLRDAPRRPLVARGIDAVGTGGAVGAGVDDDGAL